jgi:hypothetical protein
MLSTTQCPHRLNTLFRGQVTHVDGAEHPLSVRRAPATVTPSHIPSLHCGVCVYGILEGWWKLAMATGPGTFRYLFWCWVKIDSTIVAWTLVRAAEILFRYGYLTIEDRCRKHSPTTDRYIEGDIYDCRVTAGRPLP